MMTGSTVAVELPGGYWHDHSRHQEARLRPLTGEDEAFLLEAGEALSPARRTTVLLSRCLTRLGPCETVSPEAVQSLTVGDREALLLHLRGLSLGPRLRPVLRCPNDPCKEAIELDLLVSDLLLPPYPQAEEWHEASVQGNGTAYRLRFRLPTGADQEAAAALAPRDPEAAVELVRRRCATCWRDGSTSETTEEWPPAVADRLSAAMAELDPQAELRLNLTCPSCGRAISALFDTGSYLFQELAGRAKHLYREVHLLAFHYHWSEAEIMGLTVGRRRAYLDLLADHLTEERAR